HLHRSYCHTSRFLSTVHMDLLLHSILIPLLVLLIPFFFFFNDTATTEIYTLSLHDALPISLQGRASKRTMFLVLVCSTNTSLGSASLLSNVLGDLGHGTEPDSVRGALQRFTEGFQRSRHPVTRSEEHTSELQSRGQLVCRL